MGFSLGSIFGGDEGGAEQYSTLTQGQRELLDKLTGQLTPQVGKSVNAYPGQRTAGINELLQAAFGNAQGLGGLGGQGIGMASNAMGGYNPQQGYDFLNQAQGNLSSATQDFDPQSIMDALEPGRKLAMNTFNRDVIPNLLERFGATSGGSGSMNRAFADAAGDLSLGLSAQAAPYLMQGRENQLNRQMQGAGLGGELSQVPGALAGQGMNLGAQGADLLSALANLGGAQRGIEQQQLSADQQKWLESQGYNNPWLSNYAPLALGTQAFENIYTQPSQGLGSALLPALGAFAGTESGAGMIGSGLSKLGGLFGF